MTIEVDEDVLKEAEKVCAEHGITVEEAIQQFIRHTVKEAELLRLVAAAQKEAGVLKKPE